MAQNFHIEDAVSCLPDPQKNNLWEVEIGCPEGIHSIHTAVFTDKLKFRATSVSIPNRKVATTESSYLGHKIHFPLPADDGSKTISVEFVEREDNYVSIALNSWIHEIYDHSVLDNDKYTQFPRKGSKTKQNFFKKPFTTDITIHLYGLNGEVLPTYIELHNAFLSEFSGADLRYGQAGAVTYRATFTFDYWHIMAEPDDRTFDSEIARLSLD